MAEPATTRAVAAAGDERHLRKTLGFWQLTAVGFSGVIGSGWLLGAMIASQLAGPAAIVSWVIGAMVLLVSAIGSADFGGLGVIPAPWDTVTVAVIGFAAWSAGVKCGLRHLAVHPAPEPSDEQVARPAA